MRDQSTIFYRIFCAATCVHSKQVMCRNVHRVEGRTTPQTQRHCKYRHFAAIVTRRFHLSRIRPAHNSGTEWCNSCQADRGPQTSSEIRIPVITVTHESDVLVQWAWGIFSASLLRP